MRSGASSSGGGSARTLCKPAGTEGGGNSVHCLWRRPGITAEMVERAEEKVREWLSQWRQARLSSVVTGHAVGENEAKLKRARKQVSDGKT